MRPECKLTRFDGGRRAQCQLKPSPCARGGTGSAQCRDAGAPARRDGQRPDRIRVRRHHHRACGGSSRVATRVLSFITSRRRKAWSSPPSITWHGNGHKTAITSIADARIADPAVAVLDLLWEAHQGPMFVATVELWVAARTNPVLLEEIKRVEPLVNDTLAAAVAQVLPDGAQRKNLRNAVYTAMDALRGVMVLSLSTTTRRSRAAAGTAHARTCARSSQMPWSTPLSHRKRSPHPVTGCDSSPKVCRLQQLARADTGQPDQICSGHRRPRRRWIDPIFVELTRKQQFAYRTERPCLS